jgi:hypothetical protein
MISHAYQGSGSAWLSSLMSHKDIIPLNVYLQKFMSLYEMAQNGILIIGLIVGAAYLNLRFHRQISRILMECLVWFGHHLACISETLIVLPLLFAFCMWMRVALATPTGSFMPMELLPPQIRLTPATGQVSMQAAPDRLVIYPQGVTSIEFSQIKSSDSRFLQISGSQPNRWRLSPPNGILALTLSGNETVNITINSERFLPSLLVTIFSWIGVITFWILHIRKSVIRQKKRNSSTIQ